MGLASSKRISASRGGSSNASPSSGGGSSKDVRDSSSSSNSSNSKGIGRQGDVGGGGKKGNNVGGDAGDGDGDCFLGDCWGEKEEEEVWEREEDVVLEELDEKEAVLGGGGKGPMSDVCIVVDSGFSFTHILPFYQGRALHKSVGIAYWSSKKKAEREGRYIGREI